MVIDKAEIRRDIGEALRKLRQSKNLSMQELATLAEIEKSQIYRIEGGKVDVRISTLYLLASVLNVDISELLKTKV